MFGERVYIYICIYIVIYIYIIIIKLYIYKVLMPGVHSLYKNSLIPNFGYD